MLRRTIALALAGLAVAAPPALGSPPHWNSQVKNGAATTSRAGDGCTFSADPASGALTVSCARHRSATLVYVFTTKRHPWGQATYAISASPWAHVWGLATTPGKSVRLTVTVHGTATVDTVSVGFYG
jgi:hypothetical protein